MALYDGFFDAVLDEDTYQYDREYDSGSFTEYYANLIGSGVCIHNNTDSMLVTWDGTAAVMAPGYLFIDGHWLKNTANYSVPVSGEGTYAILATLNMGTRRIEVETQPKADPEEYPDSLCLAYVTIDSAGAATVEDTRYNTEICGVIDTAGALSGKIEYVINYIDNEINAKLEQAEADIAAQAAVLDAKVAEVSAMVEKLAPPPIGTVKFSASSEIEDGWLRCDGSFISETDYPELVAALGKKYPSEDKFIVLSEGEIGTNITNMVEYNGWAWVYSYSDTALYGVDLSGVETTKKIPISSESEYFYEFVAPSSANPLCLSIVPHKVGDGARMFLAQVKEDGDYLSPTYNEIRTMIPIFGVEFTGEETQLEMVCDVETIEKQNSDLWINKHALPYVISSVESGAETYKTVTGYINANYPYVAGLSWIVGDTATDFSSSASAIVGYKTGAFGYQRFGFNKNCKDEAVWIYHPASPSSPYLGASTYSIKSILNETFTYSSDSTVARPIIPTSILPLVLAGDNEVVAMPSLDTFVSYSRLSTSATSFAMPSLPSAARLFWDAGAYLYGKAIYMVFVGTGILFFRSPSESDVGYLDTTSVLGTITQFGCIRYSVDEGTLYIIGQDTTNKVKLAKIVLNTLYDYANDGAWLPLIASDGVPAYIKALDTTTEEA